MNYVKSAISVLFCVALPATSASPCLYTATQLAPFMPRSIEQKIWAQACTTDLQTIKEILHNHHPLMTPSSSLPKRITLPSCPSFFECLENKFAHALEQAQKVNSYDEYQKVLLTFMKGFGGHHLSLINYSPWHGRYEQFAALVSKRSSSPLLCSITEIKPSIYWVALPSFIITTPEQIKAFEHVCSRLETLSNAHAIIFDVRGNVGGNSDFGTRILKSLYGDSLKKISFTQDRDQYLYRVTSGSIDYFEHILLPLIKKQSGTASDVYHEFDDQLQAIKKTPKGTSVVVVPTTPLINPSENLPYKKVTAQVVLITDTKVGSSATTFTTACRNIPGLLHGGTETDHTTIFNEVTFAPLPSKRMMLLYPIKLTLNPANINGEPIQPSVRFKGNIHDDHAVQTWALNLIATRKTAKTW